MTDLNLRDPGPMARFEEMIADGGVMGEISQRLMDGETLREIAKSRQVPYGKLAEWIIADTTRSERYARASRIWVDALARETVGIADNAEATKVGISHAKLQTDVRMRIASKLDRGTYGDNAAVNVNLNGARVLPDRETMVLETARAFALILATGATIADQRGKLIEHQPAQTAGASQPERPAVTHKPEDLI